MMRLAALAVALANARSLLADISFIKMNISCFAVLRMGKYFDNIHFDEQERHWKKRN